jgi:hypothetical protein
MSGPDNLDRVSVMTPEDLPALAGPEVRALLGYWDAGRNGRAMPRRESFDPVDVPQYLPGIILLDVEGERPDGSGIYRYRVVGTYEVNTRGHNPTGRLVEDGYFAESLQSALADYDQVRLSKRPLYAPVSFRDERGLMVREDSILLPFSEDGQSVSHIVVYSARQPIPQGLGR